MGLERAVLVVVLEPSGTQWQCRTGRFDRNSGIAGDDRVVGSNGVLLGLELFNEGRDPLPITRLDVQKLNADPFTCDGAADNRTTVDFAWGGPIQTPCAGACQ